MGHRSGWIVAALAAALLLARPIEPAFARKSVVKGTLNGKARTWKGRFVVGSYSGNGTIIVAARPARFGGTVRTIGFGCAIFPPTTGFPLTMTGCTANYTETKVSRNPTVRGWLNIDSTTITWDSFENGRITGHVSSVLSPLNAADGPITFEANFYAKLTGG